MSEKDPIRIPSDPIQWPASFMHAVVGSVLETGAQTRKIFTDLVTDNADAADRALGLPSPKQPR